MQTVKETLDFIIIGAQKAGTTSLFRYLAEHPEVSMPADKEAPFFCTDHIYARGFPHYMGNLMREMLVDPERRWGTATPHYMSGSVYQSAEAAAGHPDYDERTVPARIRACLPDVRLVAILRDPVERALAGHREAVMRGDDRRHFDAMVGDLLQPHALADARRRSQHTETGYIVWGEYGRILSGYFDIFPREQILVLFTDELKRDPVEVLARVQEFIGVKTVQELPNVGEKYNSGVAVRDFSWSRPDTWTSPYSPISPQGIRVALRHNSAVQAMWKAVPYDARRSLRFPYLRLARWAVERNISHSGDDVGAETLARLRKHYAQDTERLTALLGVAPPWTAAYVPG